MSAAELRGAGRSPLVQSTNTSTGWQMGKSLAFAGATIGGYAGWALGARAGTFTAFVVSIVGTAIGVYYGRKFGRELEA